MIRTNAERLVEGRVPVLGFVLAALVVAGLVLFGASSPAHAATLTVNNTLDPGGGSCDPNGGCTLREAIDAANGTPGWTP